MQAFSTCNVHVSILRHNLYFIYAVINKDTRWKIIDSVSLISVQFDTLSLCVEISSSQIALRKENVTDVSIDKR